MREKFGARTIYIPMLAVFGFYAIQFVVTFAYIIVIAVIEAASGADFGAIPDLLDDTREIMILHSNNIGAIYSIFVIMFAVVFLMVLSKGNPRAVRNEKVGPARWIASLLVIVGSSGVIYLQLAGFAALGEYVPAIESALENYAELSKMFVGSENIWMIILSTCILIPIAEELIFRGIIQGELRRVMPGFLAVLIQALIFALVHIDPVQVAYVIIPAIILGAVYEWTKSILVPIVLHMVFNFTGAALPILLADNEKAASFMMMILMAMVPVALLGTLYLFSRRKADLIATSSQAVVVSASGYSDDSYRVDPGFVKDGDVEPNEESSDYDYLNKDAADRTNELTVEEEQENSTEHNPGEDEGKDTQKDEWKHRDLE